MTESVRETRLLFLGLAFMSIAAVFAVRLDTPGPSTTNSAELAVSGWLSIFLAALFISASVIDLPERRGLAEENGTLVFGGVTLAARGSSSASHQAFPAGSGWLPIDNPQPPARI